MGEQTSFLFVLLFCILKPKVISEKKMPGCSGFIKTESSARHLPSKTPMRVFYFRCVRLYADDALCYAHAKCCLGVESQLTLPTARNVSVTKLEHGSHGEKWERR